MRIIIMTTTETIEMTNYKTSDILKRFVSVNSDLTLFRMGGGGFRPPKRFFLNNFFHTKGEGL